MLQQFDATIEIGRPKKPVDPFGAHHASSLPPSDWFYRFGTGPSVAPAFNTILDGFLHFAAHQPDAVAVEAEGQSITYGQLNAQSSKLAHHLHLHGVEHGDAVCLFLKRSIPMVVGILAAMKVGAAYVPQHVGVATDKMLRHISTVTNAKVVLTLAALQDAIPVLDGQVCLSVDDIMAEQCMPSSLPPSPVTPDDIAILLFTSGTTGTPNGVQVTHKNLCNILLTAPGDLGMRPGLRVGQILSIAFDMAAWETLGALANGATLVIRGRNIQETACRVDVLIATPSILATLDTRECRHVKTVAVAGEPCPRPLADGWASFCTFYNSCGPTETTIINTAIQHSPNKADLTIGKPTPNNTVYILDDNLRPLPFGDKGEMWAGGDCVTAGYLANPELNADRYRDDPYRPGHKMFRTRDLGRWTIGGELRHCGRVDDLVKICGFRVELDGVSRALEATQGCNQAVTLKFDDRTLVAFVSPASVDPAQAMQQVADILPYYCVPALVMPMDSLPKTARGKLDKRQLLELAKQTLTAHGTGSEEGGS